MKKIFMLFLVMVSGIMIYSNIYHEETQKVLVAAELMGFEIETIPENSDSEDVINTSLKNIGIVTYINPETNQFAALGHSLINSKDITEINGICYDVHMDEESTYENLISSKNLGNIYLDEKSPVGEIYYDSYSGIYGKIDNVEKNQYSEVETGSRYAIKKGKANLLVRLDGKNLESFEVEILAVNHIDSKKNIRIKITDDKLLSVTGGIVQGMSGTPVMQDGKLIGAINCVSIEDPKDAYAIFIDKLL